MYSNPVHFKWKAISAIVLFYFVSRDLIAARSLVANRNRNSVVFFIMLSRIVTFGSSEENVS